ncbi:MAG: quinoprotein relay system zinc metallohydrolase 1 [Geminicoccaceae bacterium]
MDEQAHGRSAARLRSATGAGRFGHLAFRGQTEYFSFENGGDIVNCILIETGDGLVLIDSGISRRFGEALRASAAQLSGKPVTQILITHHHPDHFFGNQVFEEVPKSGLAGTVDRAIAPGDAYADNLYRLLGDWMRGTEAVPPDRVIDGGDLVIGGRPLEILAHAGHTGADMAILDRDTGTLIAGDLLFLDRAPTTPDADIASWLQSIDALERLEVSGIVPGHGPFDTKKRSIAQTRDYLVWLDGLMRKAANDGADMVDLIGELPAEWAELGANPKEFQRSVSHLFRDYENEALPLLD